VCVYVLLGTWEILFHTLIVYVAKKFKNISPYYCRISRAREMIMREHLFYLTTHDYVVILCVPPTLAIPAFVVVAWAREVSSFNRRKASVYVQAVVWWSVSSMDVVGEDLGMGPLYQCRSMVMVSPFARSPKSWSHGINYYHARREKTVRRAVDKHYWKDGMKLADC
jgi:hypothetical protein